MTAPAPADASPPPPEPREPPPPSARPFVRRHHWIVRVTHWGTAVVLAGMITSGLQIYEAYARFGNRGATTYPNPLEGEQFPHWSRLGRSEEHTSELQSLA